MRVGVEIGKMTMAANGAGWGGDRDDDYGGERLRVVVEIGMMSMAANGPGWGGDREYEDGGERCGLGWR